MRELTQDEIKLVSGGEVKHGVPVTRPDGSTGTGTRVTGTRQQNPWLVQQGLDSLAPPVVSVQGQADQLGDDDVVDPNARSAAQQAIINELEERFGEHLDFRFDGNTLQIIATTTGWVDLSVNGVRDGMFDRAQGEREYLIGGIVDQFTSADGNPLNDQISGAFAAGVAEHYIPFSYYGS
jgi:hypothetical protein